MTRQLRTILTLCAACAGLVSAVLAVWWVLAAIDMPPSPFGERWGDVE
jgi:hypothetical protein